MMIALQWIAAGIAVYGLSFEITAEGLKSLNLLSPVFVILLILFALELKTPKDRRLFCCTLIPGILLGLFCCTLIPGILLGLFYTLGRGFQTCESLSWALSSRKTTLKALCVIWGYSLLFTLSLRYLYRKLAVLCFEPGSMSKNRFWLVRGALILCFLPWYLYCFPGNLTWDSGSHLGIAIGVREPLDHHPFFITLLLRGCIRLMGGTNAGVALYSALQMLLMTAVFAWCYVRICGKARLPWGLRALLFATFAFYPVHGVFSVTLWKDVLFAIALTAFLCVLDQMESSDKPPYLLLCVTLLLIMLTRHNGIMIGLLMIPVLLLRFPTRRKSIALCGILVLGTFTAWKCLLLPAMNVSSGNSREKLSVPLQMLARAMVDHRNELDPDFYAQINAYFPDLESWEVYNPVFADPIKDQFDGERFDADPLKFAALWLRVGSLYPREYLEAFLHNGYGYWYPETDYWIMYRGISTMRRDNYGVQFTPLIDWAPVRRYCDWLWHKEYLNLPVVSLLFSPGFCFWIILSCVFYCLWRRRSLLPHTPLILLWLSIICFAPVYCEYRYVYGLFTSLPLLCGASVLGNASDDQH